MTHEHPCPIACTVGVAVTSIAMAQRRDVEGSRSGTVRVAARRVGAPRPLASLPIGARAISSRAISSRSIRFRAFTHRTPRRIGAWRERLRTCTRPCVTEARWTRRARTRPAVRRTTRATTGESPGGTAGGGATKSAVHPTTHPPRSSTTLSIEVRPEGTLSDLLRGLRGALLHHLVDGECLPEQALALHSLDGGPTDVGVPDHDDREALRLPRLGIDGKNGILDLGKRGEQLPNLLDLDARIEIAHVDLEHRHGTDSQPHPGTPAEPFAAESDTRFRSAGPSARWLTASRSTE